MLAAFVRNSSSVSGNCRNGGRVPPADGLSVGRCVQREEPRGGRWWLQPGRRCDVPVAGPVRIEGGNEDRGPRDRFAELLLKLLYNRLL